MSTRRIYQNKYPYLVTSNVIERFHVFDDDRFAGEISDLFLQGEKIYKYNLFSFVIMPDHFHFLLKTAESNDLSKIMQKIKSIFYKNIREKYLFKDKIWQKSFDFRIKDNKELFMESIAYIKNNPIKWQLPEKYSKIPYIYFNNKKIDEQKNKYS